MRKFLSLLFCGCLLFSMPLEVSAAGLLRPRELVAEKQEGGVSSKASSPPPNIPRTSRRQNNSGLLRPRFPTAQEYSNNLYDAFLPALEAVKQDKMDSSSEWGQSDILFHLSLIRDAYHRAAALPPSPGFEDVRQSLQKGAALMDAFCTRYSGLQSGEADSLAFFRRESQKQWEREMESASSELAAALEKLPDPFHP